MARRNPVSEYLAQIGRKGGEAKVSKGFAKLSPERRREIAQAAAKASAAARRKRSTKKKASR
jgi:hypothetical protein